MNDRKKKILEENIPKIVENFCKFQRGIIKEIDKLIMDNVDFMLHLGMSPSCMLCRTKFNLYNKGEYEGNRIGGILKFDSYHVEGQGEVSGNKLLCKDCLEYIEQKIGGVNEKGKET